MVYSPRPFAVITGASSGIGYELARLACEAGCDLLVVADEPEIHAAAERLSTPECPVEAVEADLSTREGVQELLRLIRAKGRLVDYLLANAGRGLGHSFLDEDPADWQRIIDTNITGTLHLIHEIAREMRDRRAGRILITGSIAGFIPGSFQAVYNGTKAFINSFSYALRDELNDTGVTVTCLMPGATETRFFERAGMLDTKVGQSSKDDPRMVAKIGFEAMMKGEAEVVSGWKNKIQTVMANVTPATLLARQHRNMAEPGTDRS